MPLIRFFAVSIATGIPQKDVFNAKAGNVGEPAGSAKQKAVNIQPCCKIGCGQPNKTNGIKD